MELQDALNHASELVLPPAERDVSLGR